MVKMVDIISLVMGNVLPLSDSLFISSCPRMNPADLSARLRSVADRVDASRRPSISAVASELRFVLASVAVPPAMTAPSVMTEPRRVSAALRSISERILASKNPSKSAVSRELRRVLATMEQKRSWRQTILEVILDQGGEVSVDSLHEGAETDDDLQEAIDAADHLVKDGLLTLDEKTGVYTMAPGREADVREAAKEPGTTMSPEKAARFNAGPTGDDDLEKWDSEFEPKDGWGTKSRPVDL